METKRFSKNDNGFVCLHCGREVPPLVKTSRNHCPYCLWSLHVDILPGDRANDCGGLLEPISVLPDAKKGYIILHRCQKCGELRRNKAALEGNIPDDRKLLISLTARQAEDDSSHSARRKRRSDSRK
ncbi:MAG: RNHCP domain-containing protein [Eubacteriales bacterium]